MDIDAVHQKLADDEVLGKADEFNQIIANALFKYTCAAESVEDCHTYLDKEGGREASVLLREVHRTAARALNRIDEANHHSAQPSVSSPIGQKDAAQRHLQDGRYRCALLTRRPSARL